MSFHQIAHELLYHVYSPIYYRPILPTLPLSRIQQTLISIVEIKTAPQKSFLILIDGEPYELEGMTFGIWLNENERGKYLQNFLNVRGLTTDNIDTANYLRYENTHIGCNMPLPTILITTKHNTK